MTPQQIGYNIAGAAVIGSLGMFTLGAAAGRHTAPDHTITRTPPACVTAARRATTDLAWLRLATDEYALHHNYAAQTDVAQTSAIGSTPTLAACR